MIERTLYSSDHQLYADMVRRFVATEILPFHAQWEKDGVVPREIWRKAGENGLLCTSIGEAWGGPGGDFLHGAIVTEELARVVAGGPNFSLHSDIIAPYLDAYGSDALKQTWLPRMVTGEAIGAIAMTEPDAGSDLQALRTRAVTEGDHFVISGQKTYISNGQLCDLVIVACRTNDAPGAKGISLVLVETDRPGFRRGRNLDKIGMKAQDTSELFFDEVRVPRSNLIGHEGRGFIQLMEQLPQERLLQAIKAIAVIEGMVDETIAYTQSRKAFGKAIADFQNTRFRLADVKSNAVMMRVYIDRCIELHLQGKLDAVDAAMAKLQATEMASKVMDECLQLHGGAGYMWEYPIARAWAEVRYARIAGGTAEIMREIIGRSLVGKNR
ncbi:MAG: acyl-CoA dehydrogenase family protein [Burkholderiaceae bacterium]